MTNTKVCVASSRPAEIGDRCRAYAAANLPPGFVLVDEPEACDIFLSVLYGHLVSEEFIGRRRCYNFHPGILPQYRGSGAFSWCILNGDRVCGVTLHELDVDIDTGPVLEIKTFPVSPTDTAQSLFRAGMDAIFDLFVSWFESLLTGERIPLGFPQHSDGARTYYRKQLQEQRDLTRYARAFSFEGKEQAFWRDRHGAKHYLTW